MSHHEWSDSERIRAVHDALDMLNFSDFKNCGHQNCLSPVKVLQPGPKFVLLAPQHRVCICVYCTNTNLCVCALENASGIEMSLEGIKAFAASQQQIVCWVRASAANELKASP